MDFRQIEADIRSFLRSSYPDIQVSARPWEKDPTRLALYFVEAKFSVLYPQQRSHYLTHLIPAEYQEKHLNNAVWFELAPGESADELAYPDESLIAAITPDVMKVVNSAKVIEALDDALCPLDPALPRAQCYGDYRNTRPILLARGFKESELFDVFHVLMAQGGYCDCEILYNVAPESRLAKEYWTARAQGRRPYDPHEGA